MDSPWVSLFADTGDDSDGITNSAALTVSTLGSGVKRSFSVNTASATTSYTAPTVDGEYTVLVTDTDSTGETASAEVSFTLDRRIATPKLSLEEDTGIYQQLLRSKLAVKLLMLLKVKQQHPGM